MEESKNPSLSQSELTQLEFLIERLHRLFIANLDAKAFDLYIEPQVKDRETGAEYSAFARLTDFITDPNAASLLLAGDPGMGKTLLSLQIAQQAWHAFIRENLGSLLNTDNPYWHKVLAKPQVEDFLVADDSVKVLHTDSSLLMYCRGLKMAQRTCYLLIRENLTSLLRAGNAYWNGGVQIQAKNSVIDESSIVHRRIEGKKVSDIHNNLPLWMWMPFLRSESNWRTELLETHLKQIGLLPTEIQLLKKACQLKICCLLPIMDGWDELPPDVVTENLYLKSGFWEEDGWPYLKVFSTCRPEAFIHYEKSQGDYRSIFHPKRTAGNYTILNLSPFESQHIKDYVERYLSTLPSDYVPITLKISGPGLEQKKFDKAKQDWLKDYQKYTIDPVILTQPFPQQEDSVESDEEKIDEGDLAEEESRQLSPILSNPNLSQPNTVDWRNLNTYLRYIEQIRGLSELVKTPFILSAVVQVLPTIVLHEQCNQNSDISRYMIYQYFVDHWLTKQATRLWSDERKRRLLPEFEADNDQASIAKLKKCLFTYSENLARLALNLGKGKINVDFTEEDTSHTSLVIPPPGQSPYFAKEPVEKNKIQLIRSGCLLKNIDNHFKFLHKSLVEYFAAKILFNGAHVVADYYLHRFDKNSVFGNLDLNDHLLTAEPSVIYLLADKAKEDMHFKYLLYQMIELSKGEPSVSHAAANAITILNAAGEFFSGRDFRGINITGAILNGALCEGTNFEGANLNGVMAQNACFVSSNFCYAQTQGLDFRELPRIKHASEITRLCMAPNGEWLLVGDAKGYVTQYSYPEGKLLQQWYRKLYNLGSKLILLYEDKSLISSLTLRSDGRLAACGGLDGTAQLIHIQERRLGARLVPVVISQPKCILINVSLVYNMVFCSEMERYLAVSSHLEIGCLAGVGEHQGNHLQIWDVHQQRFLGQYQSENEINTLATCNKGNTLLAGVKLIRDHGEKVALFFMVQYRGGDLVPAQMLDCYGHFTLSHDERLFASIHGNFYQTQDWKPLNSIRFQYAGMSGRTLTFNPQGNLLAVRSDTQLHLWDFSSKQRLYSLPIPEERNNILDSSAVISSHFISMRDEMRLLVSTGDMLYFWPLGRAAVNISYPQLPINLPIPFLKKTRFLDKIYTNDLSIKVDHLEAWKYTLTIHNKITQKIQHLPFKKFMLKEGTDFPEVALSTDQTYLVVRDKIENEYKAIGVLGSFLFMGTIIRIWNLQRQGPHWMLTHPLRCRNIMFSADSQWLIHGSKEVFIHRLEDNKELLRLTLGAKNFVTAMALAVDKSWLAVADIGGSLSVFCVQTQQRMYYLPKLPIIIQNLDLTIDAQFLVATGKKEGTLTFRVFQEKSNTYLRLIHNSMELNLTCSGIKIEGTHGLSKDNLQLLQQNDAQGIPALSSPKEHPDKKESAELVIPREISFDRAVVKRSSVTSFLKPRAVLDYSLWQVGLVRDKASKKNREHTFIVVEGMDAFGRCFFWRFDLATKTGEENVKEDLLKLLSKNKKTLPCQNEKKH